MLAPPQSHYSYFFRLGGKARKHQAARKNTKVFNKVLRFVCPFRAGEIPKIVQIEIYDEDIQNAAICRQAHETISQQHEPRRRFAMPANNKSGAVNGTL